MIFNYNNNSLKSGVYKITNTHNGRVYIGSSYEFKARWKQHKRSLTGSRQKNKFMQRDYDKCKKELGNDDFLLFEVLEVIEDKQLRLSKEKDYIEEVFGVGCYNLKKETTYVEHPERELSAREKISKASKRMWRSKSFRAKRKVIVKEFTSRPGYKEKISANSKAMWESEEYRAKQTAAHQVHSKAMWADPEHQAKMKAIKEQPEYKEKLRNNKLSKAAEGKIDKMGRIAIRLIPDLVSPEGVIHSNIASSIKEFCEYHKLNSGWFRQMILGKKAQHKGWTIWRGRI